MDKINGKTPEQIKEALCICTSKSACALYRCPYMEYIEADNCKDHLMRDALKLTKRLEAENASLKVNMEHEAARSIQMVNEIADMTVDLDINVLLERAGMEPYTNGTLSESFILRIALKRALDERDALMDDLKAADVNCETCVHANENTEGCFSADCECRFCPEACFCKTCTNDKSNYKWRGQKVKEENKRV